MTAYYKYLFSFVLSRGMPFADAEDIVQDTYLTALLHRHTLADESRLRSWLCGIAVNKIRQYRRRQALDAARQVSLDSEDTPPEPWTADSPDGRFITTEELARLQNALINLPEHWRQCAVVNLLCGLTGEETAEILGVPVQTVYNRIHKAKRALRESLGGILEMSLEQFDLMLKEGMTEAERICTHLRDMPRMIGEGRYEEAAAALLSAPVLAADSSEGHKQILQEITFALRLMRLPEDHPVRRKLTVFGEQEIRLILRLGIEGILQWDSGEPFAVWEFYDDFADFHSVTGHFEKALADCEKSAAAGNPSGMRLAAVLQDCGRHREAAEKYLAEAERDPESRPMAYNRIANCFKDLGEHEKALEYQLKNRELILSGAVYPADSEPYRYFLAGETYFLACTYARLGRREEMLAALGECIAVREEYRDWARAQGAFADYRKDPDFISLCGSGEGSMKMML